MEPGARTTCIFINSCFARLKLLASWPEHCQQGSEDIDQDARGQTCLWSILQLSDIFMPSDALLLCISDNRALCQPLESLEEGGNAESHINELRRPSRACSTDAPHPAASGLVAR